MKLRPDPYAVAGTHETFHLEFLEFNHQDQRWTAECLIGEELVKLASHSGAERWYVVEHPEVEVPRELCNHLARITQEALSDYKKLKAYRKAVGELPRDLIQ